MAFVHFRELSQGALLRTPRRHASPPSLPPKLHGRKQRPPSRRPPCPSPTARGGSADGPLASMSVPLTPLCACPHRGRHVGALPRLRDADVSAPPEGQHAVLGLPPLLPPRGPLTPALPAGS